MLTTIQKTAAQDLAIANKNDISGVLCFLLNSGIMTDCFTCADNTLLNEYDFGDVLGYITIDTANMIVQEMEGKDLQGFVLLNKLCAIHDDAEATAIYIASLNIC